MKELSTENLIKARFSEQNAIYQIVQVFQFSAVSKGFILFQEKIILISIDTDTYTKHTSETDT